MLIKDNYVFALGEKKESAVLSGGRPGKNGTHGNSESNL